MIPLDLSLTFTVGASLALLVAGCGALALLPWRDADVRGTGRGLHAVWRWFTA